MSKIGSLFAANMDPVPSVNPASPAASAQTQAAQDKAQALGEAVVLSPNIQSSNKAPLVSAEAAQAARVQRLKEQIARGEYKPDSASVAKAIIQDLA